MMFTRFTDRSRTSVEAAFDEARMLGHDSLGDEDLLLGILRADEGIGVEARKETRRLGDKYLGTEHILLGLLRNADGMAFRMLARMGVSPEMVEERLFELRGRAAG